jgi:hypothetical protein
MADAITVRPVQMDERARDDLMQIDGMSEEVVELYEAEQAEGSRAVWGIFCGHGSRIGTFVWSVRDETEGRFFVLDDAYCKPVFGVQIARVLERVGRSLAKRHGCDRLRFWTSREAFMRVFQNEFRVRYLMEGEA